MKVSHKGEFKPILIEGLDWSEQQNVEFTIEVLMGGTDEEPLNVLNIFGEYREKGSKQKIKFEIPLTEKESKGLALELMSSTEPITDEDIYTAVSRVIGDSKPVYILIKSVYDELRYNLRHKKIPKYLFDSKVWEMHKQQKLKLCVGLACGKDKTIKRGGDFYEDIEVSSLPLRTHEQEEKKE